MFEGSAVARISVEPARFTGITVCLIATSSGISWITARIDLELVEVDRRDAVLLRDEVGELRLLEEAELRDLRAEAAARAPSPRRAPSRSCSAVSRFSLTRSSPIRSFKTLLRTAPSRAARTQPLGTPPARKRLPARPVIGAQRGRLYRSKRRFAARSEPQASEVDGRSAGVASWYGSEARDEVFPFLLRSAPKTPPRCALCLRPRAVERAAASSRLIRHSGTAV